MNTILGLDVGLKKIGVAVGDRQSGFAWTRPAVLVDTWDQAWPLIVDLVGKENVETVVVGMPVEADGTPSQQATSVEDFIEQLKSHVRVPIITRSERATTQAVIREQQSIGRKLKRGEEDSLAAQLIVEGYLQETPS